MEPKKTKKHAGKIPVILMALLLVVVIVVNVICGIFSNVITMFFSNADNINEEMIEKNKAKSLDVIADIAVEGSVLLRNENETLPLQKNEKKVNMFGWSTVSPIMWGGIGSASGNTNVATDLLTGMKNNGFEVNQELIDFYDGLEYSRDTVNSLGEFEADYSKIEAPLEEYSDELWENAKEYSDVAIVTYSRMGIEEEDLPSDMSEMGGRADEHYLELGAEEEALLDKVLEMGFEKVIVLINASYPFEMGFLEEKGVDAALWIGGPGQTGMNSVAKILSGEINPSGRTTDTYAYDFFSSPATENWGEFYYADTEYEAAGYDGTEKRNLNFVECAEGIYVGYRYYETRWVDNNTGICDEDAYRKVVQYPFGYGLSYTQFDQKIKGFEEDGKQVTVTVEVTNTGDVAGKEVVQVYVTPPYYEGGIEKAHVNLEGFGKTQLLQPGESQEVEITFDIEELASFDYKDAGCYVLDQGKYEVKVMKNAHELIDSRTFQIEDTIVYNEENKRESDEIPAVSRFQEAQGDVQYLSRADWEGTWPNPESNVKEASPELIASLQNNEPDPALIDPNAEPIVIKDNGLELADLIGVPYDDPQWELLLEQLSVEDMVKLISLGGYATQVIESVGKPYAIDLDGPTGLNSLVNADAYQGVLYPSTVMLAATWSTELATRMGDAFSEELNAWGVSGLYGPSMNIHRHPLGGRNYEYYSEDPILTGKLAGCIVKSFCDSGVYCFIKHFAAYDQTLNGFGLAVWSNEQALRELSFKPFEMCVKDCGARAVMSSYNRIGGGPWNGGNYTLLTEVLRNEWGFEGMVITDWFTAPMDADLGIYAGNDLMLATTTGNGNEPDDMSNSGQQAMRRACHNILYAVANSNAMEINYMGPKMYWAYALAAVDAVVLILEGIFFWRWNKKRKQGAISSK